MVDGCYWICGDVWDFTAQEALWGSYMLRYVHCLFVYLLRERIHTAKQQTARLANSHYVS